MKEYVYKDYKALCSSVADQIVKQLIIKPNSLITIAGGNTPIGVFSALVDLAESQEVDYSKVKFLSLDEWVSLDGKTKGSCRQTLDEFLFCPLKLKENQVIFFDGDADNLTNECNRIDQALEEAGGIDLIILGIGMNGHLGFNEPNIITQKSSIVKLAPVTKAVMGKYFEKEVSLTHGVTLGYDQILGAKQIILMASGAPKKEVIKQLYSQKISYEMPATLLKSKSKCSLYLDVAAKGENEKN